jgi:hypothetical protein
VTELKNTEAGLALTARGSWEQAEPAGNVILAARAGEGEGSVAATIVVTTSSLGNLELQDWARGTSELLGSRLVGYLLLDQSSGRLAGRPAAVTLATYVDDQGAELTAQQWLAIEGRGGITLTITCGTEDFPGMRATAEEIATSLTWEKAS